MVAGCVVTTTGGGHVDGVVGEGESLRMGMAVGPSGGGAAGSGWATRRRGGGTVASEMVAWCAVRGIARA